MERALTKSKMFKLVDQLEQTSVTQFNSVYLAKVLNNSKSLKNNNFSLFYGTMKPITDGGVEAEPPAAGG